jgi:hypothetical protein
MRRGVPGPRRATAALVVLAAALLAAGCGKKGPPIAPEQRIPRPVTGLAATAVEGAIQVTWANPTRRADNTRLVDLVLARVYRTEDAGLGEPKPALLSRGRILGYPELARIDLLLTPGPPGQRPIVAAPPPGAPVSWTIEGNAVRVTDGKDLVYGRRYTYVVVVEDYEGRVSPPSPRVSIVYLAPPRPPTGLTAVAGEREVRLSWTAPTALADGSPLTGAPVYEVLRAATPDAPLTPITRAPVAGTTFVDHDVENDRAYTYAVRAIRVQGTTVARGEPSATVTATPIDTTPPSTPTSLVATPAGAGVVRLSWAPSPEADVAVYVVYRGAGGAPLERVGTVPAPSTTFVDRDLPRGTYRYAVSAQDASARANESARSAEATVTVP